MADDPFPPTEQNAPPRPDDIGERRWTFIFPANGQPYANYAVEILDQYAKRFATHSGKLFEVGGVDHLRAVDKQAVVDMDAYLEGAAREAWIPN